MSSSGLSSVFAGNVSGALQLSVNDPEDAVTVPDLTLEVLFGIMKVVDELYENDGESFLSDSEYDQARAILHALQPSHSFFIGVGANVRGEKVKLPYQMGSLDQTPVGKISDWISKVGTDDVVITDKMDGVSCLLVYDISGNLQIAFTRGNGYEGQDITRHLEHVLDFPKKIKQKMVVRCELEFSERNFANIQDKVTRKGGDKFKNARNAMAGLLNNKTIPEIAANNMSLFAYDIVDMPHLSKSEQLSILKQSGFRTPYATKLVVGELTDSYLVDYIIERKKSIDYAIDGIVLDVDSAEIRNRLNTDSLNPKWATKYKVSGEDDKVTTVVESVEWNISKHGYAKPRIKVKPFELGGVTINHTTGFNAKYILENNIGEGTEVVMVRSGDVIPYIVSITKSTTAEMPENLDQYHWSENEVDLILNDLDTLDVVVKQLTSWATSMEIPLLKEGVVKSLVENGIDTPEGIINLDRSKFVSIIGKNGGKIYDALHKILFGIDLHVLLGSHPSFGVGLGVRKFKILCDHLFSEKQDIYSLILKGEITKENIIGADGFESKTADKILDGLPAFIDYYNNIKSSCVVVTSKQSASGSEFDGQNICFSGVRDKELQAKIEDGGGKVSSGVSKNTTLLVVKDVDSGSSKVTKAKSLGIEVISIDDFRNRI